MNYFELINKCLVELNYKKCSIFSELVKNDHERIKNILNMINSEICSFDNWNFLLRKSQIVLPAKAGEISNMVDGRIHSVYVDNVKFEFYSDFERFLLNKQSSNTYTFFNDKILFPVFNSDKVVEVVYYTAKCAKSESGEDVTAMSVETDESLIPASYAEPILVYGTCMRFKGSSEHNKFSYWYGMYKDAIANMRAKVSKNAFDAAEIKLKRQ